MKITVLGNQGPFPGPNGACSGYLVETSDAKILLDCGSGVLGNLQKVCKISELDAIILSHLHSDHISDINVFKYAILVSRIRSGEVPLRSIDLYCPSTPEKSFNIIEKKAFNIDVLTDNKNINIKDLNISFSLMEHPYESYAIKISNNGKAMVYSGDTSYTKKLAEFSKNADLLLSDAAFTEKHITHAKLVHMTAKENALIAKQANVKRLMLTHFWPYDNISIHIKEAKEIFDKVETSEIMKSYEI